MNGARVGLLLFLAITHCSCSEKVHKNAAVYTVATDETDGFQRYIFSAHEYGINPNVLGMGKTWKGGDMSRMGGGWKVNLLKEALQPLKDDKEQIILFTDAYDVIFLNSLRSIVGKFKETGARILFGVEPFCWPKVELSEVYPNVTKGKKYLNSGIYIGYAPEVLELLERRPIKDDEDDQLFFTEAYLDKEFREKVHMQLDHTSEIIQNLNGAISEIELIDELYKESTYKILQNVVTHTRPMIVHGNGPSKIQLNAIGNYLARSWSPEEGCRHCKLGQINLEEFEEMPTVLVAIFVVIPTPFLEEQLEKVANLEYPKNRIHLFIHNNVKYHTEHIKNFTEKYSKQYLSFKEIKPTDETSEWTARDLSLDDCSKKNCDFYFAVDSVAHLDNEHTLKLLIAQNRTVVAPMMTRSGKAWSNFWGALTADGYYARAPDYMEIVHNKKRGLWNVPFISSCYLLNGTMIRKYDRTKLTYAHDFMDADMAFCNSLRKLEVFMYVTNRVDFGHLVDPESYDITRADPDMYQIFDNEEDWEARYIRPEYKDNFDPENKPIQPCPDVYWFPIVTDRFCDDLVHMMETYGQWSSGTNQDNRLEGGYEAVPTRDIHMNQVGWEKHWLYFLKRYVLPLNELVYWGYSGDPPRSLMNFVVRYRPDEQPSLRPHHDSSTYTINIALNRAGIDYEGGGCRFIRYNCSVVDTKKGWMLMHPGRLTHFHEGLLVTKGTRYIMIAFIDP